MITQRRLVGVVVFRGGTNGHGGLTGTGDGLGDAARFVPWELSRGCPRGGGGARLSVRPPVRGGERRAGGLARRERQLSAADHGLHGGGR